MGCNRRQLNMMNMYDHPWGFGVVRLSPFSPWNIGDDSSWESHQYQKHSKVKSHIRRMKRHVQEFEGKIVGLPWWTPMSLMITKHHFLQFWHIPIGTVGIPLVSPRSLQVSEASAHAASVMFSDTALLRVIDGCAYLTFRIAKRPGNGSCSGLFNQKQGISQRKRWIQELYNCYWFVVSSVTWVCIWQSFIQLLSSFCLLWVLCTRCCFFSSLLYSCLLFSSLLFSSLLYSPLLHFLPSCALLLYDDSLFISFLLFSSLRFSTLLFF